MRKEIIQQLYNFTDNGRREIALRPEMTPSLARILAGRHKAMPKPIRWFSVPQLFRYERQQRGRLREHFQWNVDIVGESGVGADIEVLAIALDGLRELGLTPWPPNREDALFMTRSEIAVPSFRALS